MRQRRGTDAQVLSPRYLHCCRYGVGRLPGQPGGVMPRRHTHLREHRGDVVVDGLLRDEEPGRDVAVGEPLADEGEHLTLSPGQPPSVVPGQTLTPPREGVRNW